MSESIDLLEVRDFLVKLAYEAGELILSKTGKTGFVDKANCKHTSLHFNTSSVQTNHKI